MNACAQRISSAGVEGRPDNPARNVEGEEPGPRHLVGSGQKGCKGPKNRNEAPEEDHLATMAHEQVLAELDLAGRNVQARPEPHEQAVADLLTDPETDVVPDHRAGDRSCDDPGQRQIVGRSGIDGCGDEGRFTRKGRPRLSSMTMIRISPYP